MTNPSLPELYWQEVNRLLTRNGLESSLVIARHHGSDQLTYSTIRVRSELLFEVVHRQFIADLSVKEVIFGIDRYTQSGQGTLYNDIVTVFWWQGERDGNWGFRFGVIDYIPPPVKVVEPINWHNAFWNENMSRSIEQLIQTSLQHVKTMRQQSGMSDAEFQRILDERVRVKRGHMESDDKS